MLKRFKEYLVENVDADFYNFLDDGDYNDSIMFHKLQDEYDFEVTRQYNLSDVSRSSFLMFELRNNKCYYKVLYFNFLSLGIIDVDYIYRYQHDKVLMKMVDGFNSLNMHSRMTLSHNKLLNIEMLDKMLSDFLFYYLHMIFIDLNKDILNDEFESVFGLLDLNNVEQIESYIMNMYDIALKSSRALQYLLRLDLSYLPKKLYNEDFNMIKKII